VLLLQHLYDLTVVHSNRELVVSSAQAAGAAAIVLAFAGVFAPSLILDPSTFVTALGVFVVPCSPGASRSTSSPAIRNSKSAC